MPEPFELSHRSVGAGASCLRRSSCVGLLRGHDLSPRFHPRTEDVNGNGHSNLTAGTVEVNVAIADTSPWDHLA